MAPLSCCISFFTQTGNYGIFKQEQDMNVMEDKQMDIRLVATDMDGTLLDSRKQKPADFIPWVKTHPEIKTVIASGRQYYTLRADFEEIADDLIYIAENGGLVFEKGQIIYSNEMNQEDIRQCLDLVKDMPLVTPIVCGAKSAYMKHAPEYIEAEGHMYYTHLEFVDDLYACMERDVIVKIALFVDEFQAESVMPSMAALNKRVSPVLSGASWIDVANASVNKGSAVEAIQKAHQIRKEESMAFGDYLNDYALLLACTESYAMANAHDKLKEIAKYQTASNDEDGVMKVLRTL